MKIGHIKVITVKDLKGYPDLVIYQDENIAILNGIDIIIKNHHDIAKLGCLLMVFCEEGEVMCNINGHQYLLQKDNCAILPPGSIIRPPLFNTLHTIKIVAISQTFIVDILSLQKETWDIMYFLYNHPIFPITRSSSYKMYLYKELLFTLIQEQPHAYSKQTRRYHFCGMICEMFALLNQQIPDYERKNVNRTRSIYIVRNFIELVKSDNGSHRSVSYYADRLFYSAKHLSSTIKEVTGESPLQIINKHAIRQIRYKLKHSDISMKELADFFNFPNTSFFCKFVKAHTGMSPMQCRITEKELED